MDIRPGEMQRVVLCFGGAFLLLAFVVLALSVRDAFFLDIFDIESLPYVNAAVAALSLPAVGLFASLLARHHPWSVLQKVSILFCIGLGAIWAASRYEDIVAVVFYIWTVIGAMLLTSGFWVLVAESFEVRGAKRLYGLIAAGGTAGAMAMGLSLNRVTLRFQLIQLVPLLIGIVILLCVVEFWIYRLSDSAGRSVRHGREPLTEDLNDEGGKPAGFLKIRENLGTIWNSPYLRSIASIVFVATVASSIVGYQFKEYAEIAYIDSGERLASFFGAFYGWTGGVALAVQLFFTARIMRSAGITPGLAILPGLLLLGSAGFLAFPGLLISTLVRGGDYALR